MIIISFNEIIHFMKENEKLQEETKKQADFFKLN